MRCCDSDEIAGRTGGDEFYIVALDYSETQLNRFLKRMKDAIASYNESNDRPYALDVSYGTYMTETDSGGRLEDFIRISDARMYEQKQQKHHTRH
jgi:diguanylate cyclase (GGDEF)-like protein